MPSPYGDEIRGHSTSLQEWCPSPVLPHRAGTNFTPWWGEAVACGNTAQRFLHQDWPWIACIAVLHVNHYTAGPTSDEVKPKTFACFNSAQTPPLSTRLTARPIWDKYFRKRVRFHENRWISCENRQISIITKDQLPGMITPVFIEVLVWSTMQCVNPQRYKIHSQPKIATIYTQYHTDINIISLTLSFLLFSFVITNIFNISLQNMSIMVFTSFMN